MAPHLAVGTMRNDKMGEPCFYLMGQNQTTVCSLKSVPNPTWPPSYPLPNTHQTLPVFPSATLCPVCVCCSLSHSPHLCAPIWHMNPSTQSARLLLCPPHTRSWFMSLLITCSCSDSCMFLNEQRCCCCFVRLCVVLFSLLTKTKDNELFTLPAFNDFLGSCCVINNPDPQLAYIMYLLFAATVLFQPIAPIEWLTFFTSILDIVLC